MDWKSFTYSWKEQEQRPRTCIPFSIHICTKWVGYLVVGNQILKAGLDAFEERYIEKEMKDWKSQRDNYITDNKGASGPSTTLGSTDRVPFQIHCPILRVITNTFFHGHTFCFYRWIEFYSESVIPAPPTVWTLRPGLHHFYTFIQLLSTSWCPMHPFDSGHDSWTMCRNQDLWFDSTW
jgi:hypothetical protein